MYGEGIQIVPIENGCLVKIPMRIRVDAEYRMQARAMREEFNADDVLSKIRDQADDDGKPTFEFESHATRGLFYFEDLKMAVRFLDDLASGTNVDDAYDKIANA